MLLVLGGLTLYGYFKGMAWQIAYIASFIASYFLAVKFADRFAPVFGDSAPWNKLLAMAAIYVATSFVIWMLFRVVHGAIDKVKLKSFDRQMGLFIGFARGVVWCLGITFIALTFVTRFVPSVQQHIVQSRSGRCIARFIDESKSLFPPEVHEVIGPYLQQIDQGLDMNQPLPQGFPQGVPQGFGGGQANPSTPTSGSSFLESLSGQVSQQVNQFQQQVQAGLQNQVQSQLQSQFGGAGATGGSAVGAPASAPNAGRVGGLSAWPASTTQPGSAPTASGNTAATPAGWPAPPAGTGWPGR
ncbi:MAG: CvpA family protein [Planctomycetota bacterium]